MSIEDPTPNAEQGPKFLSAEEVEAQMAKFITGPEVPGSKGGWGNPPEFSEIVTTDETGTNFFQISYQMDAKKTGDAIIWVIHWQRGSDGSREWVRGNIRARYSGTTGQWSDADIDFAPFPMFAKISPAYEQKLVFPTPEEISKKLQEFCSTKNPLIVQNIEDARGTSLHEVVVTDAAGDDTIYTYRRAGEKAATTDITYASFVGKHTDNVCVGAGNMSTYDQDRGLWVDVPRAEVAETGAVTQTTVESLVVAKPDTSETEMTKEKFEGLLKEANVQSVYTLFDIARTQGAQCQKTLEMIYTQLMVLNISNSSASKQYRLDTWDPQGKLTEAQFTAFTTEFRELSDIAGAEITKESIKNGLTEIHEEIPAPERVRDVIELFDTAEALLETTDIPTLEAREREDFGLALKKRAAAKAFADRITTELIKLNRTFGPPATFDDWNPAGDIAKDQFNDLSRRRKILANAVGSLNALKIRHDLNDI